MRIYEITKYNQIRNRDKIKEVEEEFNSLKLERSEFKKFLEKPSWSQVETYKFVSREHSLVENKSLDAQIAQLRVEKGQLRDKENKLLDERKDLRDERKELRAQEPDYNELDARSDIHPYFPYMGRFQNHILPTFDLFSMEISSLHALINAVKAQCCTQQKI